ncbi:type II toxin-antitoxin system RelE/ParE family toxin [Desulfobacula sp.]|uniref:type II toxin-antitoxin system RelE/ParE family toxin n=1 Tax=Desulfobacula sp. TaxID=2593537 RepID=UPI0025C1375A|nr:type II toxin-antitoxin system RelE/ParE family toxin [Desulfobacula sp.]
MPRLRTGGGGLGGTGILCFFDGYEIIILTHAFQKKTQKKKKNEPGVTGYFFVQSLKIS